MQKSLDIIIEKIYNKNGDVIKFAGIVKFNLIGDACLSIFPESNFLSRDECINVGVETALSMVEELHVDNIVLHVHSGVGFGLIRGYNVGGVDSQWEFFISGEPLEQVSSAEHEAELGQMIVSKKVYDLLDKKLLKQFTIKPSGNVLITQMTSTTYSSTTRERSIEKMMVGAKIPKVIQYLYHYISPPCVKVMLNGYKWGNELRNITTLFINLKGMRFSGPDALNHVQAVVTEVQRSLSLVDGVLCRFSVDDKGTVILCAFGLAFYQHDNDPYRAVIFGLDLRKKMMLHKLECWIGISYGPAFCGTVGGSTRCEYTVHGTNVNLAARCMVASRGVGILVEENVYNQIRRQFNWGQVTFHKLKGYDRIMPLYQVKGMKTHFNFYLEDSIIVGRLKERMLLDTIVNKIASNSRRVVYLEGEAGMGKTYLLTYIASKVRETNEEESEVEIAWFNTNGNDMSSHKMFHLWIGIFSSIFLLESLLEKEDQLEMINNLVPPEHKSKLHVFNQLFPELNIDAMGESNDQSFNTEQMLFDTLQNTCNLLMNNNSIVNDYLEQLKSNAVFRTRKMMEDNKQTKILMVFEDIQFSDPSSLELLNKCIKKMPNVNFLLTSRSSKEGNQFKESITDTIVLEKFSKIEIAEQIKILLRQPKVDLKLIELIFTKSSGNPLYSSELIDVLEKQNLINVFFN